MIDFAVKLITFSFRNNMDPNYCKNSSWKHFEIPRVTVCGWKQRVKAVSREIARRSQHGVMFCSHNLFSSATVAFRTIFFVTGRFQVKFVLNKSKIALWCDLALRLTKDGSKRTNHCVQSSQPMTTRLTHDFVDQSHQRSEYLYHPLTLHKSLDSDDDFRSGCRNVSQCHLKQSFSGLHSTGRSYST